MQDTVLGHSFNGFHRGALSFHSQHSRLAPVRVWFKWLVKQNYLLANPASEIELPRLGYRLPTVLTVAEAESLGATPGAAVQRVGTRHRRE